MKLFEDSKRELERANANKYGRALPMKCALA